MAYCPKCRYEYETGVMMCPDCGVGLVDELSARGQAAVRPDASWVVMGQVSSTIKSEMAKGSLDSNNIPSVILSSSFNIGGKGFGGGGLLHTGSEGNVIMVPREFEEDALLILESVLGDDLIQPEQS